MNCERCLGVNPFFCGPIHAARALASSVVRLWRNALNALSQFG